MVKVGKSDLGYETLVTVIIAVIALYFLWPQMDTVSKGLCGLFACIAGLSIHGGTWTQNHRDLRRQARDERRQAYQQVKKMVTGKQS